MIDLIPAVNSNDHSMGNSNAPIELVEYGDYECPYCGQAYPIVKELQKKFGNDLKLVFRNFPLKKVHPNAIAAAIATEAAALQDKFWEMHDIIFENQRHLSDENLLLLAKEIGLQMDQFQRDILRPDLAAKVRSDFESGMKSGVNRIPGFFVNGKKFNGDWSTNQLEKFLECERTWIEIS